MNRLLKNNLFAKFNPKLFHPRSLSGVSLEKYGKHTFKGKVAAPYLIRHGLSADTLDSPSWTTNGSSDKVNDETQEFCCWFI